MLVRGAQTGHGLRRFSLEISRWDFQGEDVILFSGAAPKRVEANNKPYHWEKKRNSALERGGNKKEK